MDILNKYLYWRYAVKRFDTKKKISEKQLQDILQLINLSASSYGIRPYKIIVIKDLKIRDKLKKYSFGQPQIVEASHIILFTSYIHINSKYIEDTIYLFEKERYMPKGSLENYKNNILNNKNYDQENWKNNQIYIALGTLLFYCAIKQIDSCPIEGFSKEHFDRILKLYNYNLKSVVLTALGYRSNKDTIHKKVRQPISEMILK
jgi:nitroreductase / dihydropteridine reductase